MQQVTLISFFKYQGLINKWQALGRMGNSPLKRTYSSGLTFWKPLGSGSGNGFSIKPDFSTYGLLTVFNTVDDANNFVNSLVVEHYNATAISYSHLFMYTIKTHGTWSRSNPFIKNNSIAFDANKPLAVITRATIKPRLALHFWRNVPKVSGSMKNHEGLLFSKGVGEWPIFMQATFSLWKTQEAMMTYAYANKRHTAMIKKTRNLQWYSEELFARFQPFKILGNLIPNVL